MTKSCEERIADELKDRLADMAEIIEATDTDDMDKMDSAYERWSEFPLSIDHRIEVRVQLSWGGPSDEFLVTIDPEDKSILSIRYRFLDWFDGAERTLDLGSEDGEIAERFLSYFTEVMEL